jgi:hypothetical protein
MLKKPYSPLLRLAERDACVVRTSDTPPAPVPTGTDAECSIGGREEPLKGLLSKRREGIFNQDDTQPLLSLDADVVGSIEAEGVLAGGYV